MTHLNGLVRAVTTGLLSILLVLTPLFGFVAPAHAAISADQLADAFGITDLAQRSELAASFGRAPSPADCIESIFVAGVDSGRFSPLAPFVSCGSEIRTILTIVNPYLKQLQDLNIPGIGLPPPFDLALPALNAIYMAPKSEQLINYAQSAIDVGGCLSYAGILTAAAFYPLTAPTVYALSGPLAVGLVAACANATPHILAFFQDISNIVLIAPPEVNPQLRATLAPPPTPAACFANGNTNLYKPTLTCYAERAYGNPNGSPTGGGGTNPTPPPLSCAPGASEVALYVDANFQGPSCVVKGIGAYNDPTALGLPNDSISSVKVGANVKVRVCNNAGMNSPCEDIVQDETALHDNSIGDNTISAAQVMPRGGAKLCSGANYTGTCKYFGNGEVDDLAAHGLGSNVSSVQVPSNHTLFMYSGLDQTGTPSAWNGDTADLTPHSWNDFARSIRVEPRYDTSCNQDPNANGVMLYRDPNFGTGGGCMLTTTDIRDLGFTFPRLTALKFVGNYRFNYKVTIYRNTDYTNVCGVYTLDQSDLRECASQGLSLRIEPYSPPPQATNYAPAALRDSTNTGAVVDDNLSTQWIGGHKKALGFVFDSPKEIKSVVVFDRDQSSSDNNQINKVQLVFSDGTVINDIDMTSGGPRCAEVNFPAKTAAWVNVVPVDASGNNGYREVQIWGVNGTAYANANCVMKYSRTPAVGSGPAPTVSWPVVTPPNAAPSSPAMNASFSANTTAVRLTYATGDQFRVHVWGSNYDFTSGWSNAAFTDLTALARGKYYWQVQSRNAGGEGQWSAIQAFTINNPPVVMGSTITMDGGTNRTVQVQAYDAEQQATTLSASGLPGFATFTYNGDGVGTLALNPSTSQAGEYSITFTASDGSATGVGQVVVTVNGQAQPTGYQAQYYNNLTLGGTPVLTRTETTVNNDWSGGGPGSPVGVDNFSARWTKTDTFAAGAYTFSATADDGVRLYVDGVLVIDKWIDQGSTTYTATLNLTAGTHTVVMEYYERGGGAVAKLAYQQQAAPPAAPGITSGSTYKLLNVNGGKALDVAGGVAADGTNVQVWSDTGGNAQKWVVTRTADGTYTLVNSLTNRALDVNGNGTSDGTNVHIWTVNSSPAQKWAITRHADGSYKLVHPTSGKALDVSGGSSADGANVQIWTDNGSGAQKWQMVEVAAAPAASGYTAQYFNNQNLSGTPVWTGAETTIDHDWGGNAPNASTPNDHFSARWIKTVAFSAGAYRFTATGDDGLRLYIDDQLVLDKWIDQGSTTYVVDKTLTAGNHTIRYEYYENGGGAVAKLSYQLL